MSVLPLAPDELLSTTRAVRKRLDFTRDVPDDVVRECVGIAMQSPSGSNNMTMQFVIVRDAAKRAEIGAIYRECYTAYSQMDGIYIGSIDKGDPALNEQQQRSASSADYLGEHMGEAPVLVVPCISGRVDGMPGLVTASAMANVQPAMWSFMLAARSRGLGTCWTSVHLMAEQRAADVLGIPYDSVQQICLSPLAYTRGTDFKPAARPDPETIIHWDSW